ncbi:MAG: secondary thiamine-phosphate synthase enzyme YjbQ [Elusimicrobia bacterium]|nr:secondary thiamine-phosphate synthase enzyme YjbQ [Elusimicrobiota bacterium]
MKILTRDLTLKTSGAGDLINITDELRGILKESKLKEGAMTVFAVGSTFAVTSFEYEPGLIKDMKELYEKLVPSNRSYGHDDTWGDANGFSHLRAALQGPSLTLPFRSSQLLTGVWQQVVAAEFDNRPRTRQIIVQLMGE